MKTRIIISILLLVSPIFAEDDVRSKVQGKAKDLSYIIEPGKHIYGHLFGMTEDEFIKAEGKPVGYVKLSGHRSIMIYGRSHGYIFTNGKLSGVRIASQIIDWKLANKMQHLQKHDDENWKLSNGVYAGMTKKKFKALLGDKVDTKDYMVSFKSSACVVEVSFARYSFGEDKGTEKICSIYISEK